LLTVLGMVVDVAVAVGSVACKLIDLQIQEDVIIESSNV